MIMMIMMGADLDLVASHLRYPRSNIKGFK